MSFINQRRASALPTSRKKILNNLTLKTTNSFTGTMFNKAKFALPHTMKHSSMSKKRRSRKTLFNHSRRKGIFAVRESISKRRKQRDVLLKKCKSIWEKVRIRLLDNPARLHGDLKEASVAIGLSLIKSSSSFRKLAISIFNKEEKLQWEKQIVYLVLEEVDSIKALKHFLTVPAYEKLCNSLTIKTFMNNDIIYRQDDPSTCKYTVLQGRVILSTKKNLITTICEDETRMDKLQKAKHIKNSSSNITMAASPSSKEEQKEEGKNKNNDENEANMATGWNIDGWEKLIQSVNQSVKKQYKAGTTFGSRSNGENLIFRSSTATGYRHEAIKYNESNTTKALVDVLVLDYDIIDEIVQKKNPLRILLIL